MVGCVVAKPNPILNTNTNPNPNQPVPGLTQTLTLTQIHIQCFGVCTVPGSVPAVSDGGFHVEDINGATEVTLYWQVCDLLLVA